MQPYVRKYRGKQKMIEFQRNINIHRTNVVNAQKDTRLFVCNAQTLQKDKQSLPKKKCLSDPQKAEKRKHWRSGPQKKKARNLNHESLIHFKVNRIPDSYE